MIGNKLGPVDRTVNVLIDRSYPVVKEVYLHLEDIDSVTEAIPSINKVSENLGEIHKVQEAAENLKDIHGSLTEIQQVQDHLASIDAVAPRVDAINTVAINIKEVVEAKANAEIARESANKALASETNSKASAELAKNWAVSETEVEPSLYSSRKYAIDSKSAKDEGQRILEDNKKIEGYLKSKESVYDSLHKNEQNTSIVAGNINSVVNVATDLKGESIQDASRDLGMIGEDGESGSTAITGGNIKKVADNIDAVRTTADNIEAIKTAGQNVDIILTTKNEVTQLAGQVKQDAATATEQATIATDQATLATATLPKVTAEGTKQIQAIKDQETLSKQAVIAEGDKQVARVTKAGSSEVNKVTAEGTKQVQLVETQVTEATKQAGIATAKAEEAKTSAQSATTKATEALNSANTAKKHADSANSAKTDLESARDTATTQAGIATTQANLATAQANEAKKQADLAKEYAGQASAGQINADWNETVSTSKAFIKNKPDIYTKTEVNNKFALTSELSKKVDVTTYTTDKATFALKTEVTPKADKTYVDGQLATKATSAHQHTEAEIEGLTTKLTTLAPKDTVYTKEQVDQKIGSVYKYKGSKANKGALPSSGNTTGDVWNTEDTGMNYAWDGAKWDALGSTADLSNYLTKSEAQSAYLGITAKAESAKTADSVNWANVSGKPDTSTFVTSTAMSDYVDPKISALEDKKANTDWVNKTFAGKIHTHTIENITDLHTILQAKAQVSWVNDNFATKNELSGKSDKNHTHSDYVSSSVLNNYATKDDLSIKANAIHTHSGYVTTSGNVGSLSFTEKIVTTNSVDGATPRIVTPTSSQTVTVYDGKYNEAWVTVVALNTYATINLGSNWSWSGDAPTLAKGLVTLAWFGNFGVATFTKYGA